MATVMPIGFLGLFGDNVYSSTDLNRRSGEVLDHARRGPVTISRNKEQFALLRREQAAELVRAALQFGPTLELIAGVLSVIEGGEPPASLSWLKAFDTADLQKMIREVLTASASALHDTGDWDTVNAIIHEWHESAIASDVLKQVMSSPADASPLPNPETPLEVEAELASASRE